MQKNKKAIAKKLLIALTAIDEAQRLIDERVDEKCYAVILNLTKHYKEIKTILNENFDDLS